MPVERHTIHFYYLTDLFHPWLYIKAKPITAAIANRSYAFLNKEPNHEKRVILFEATVASIAFYEITQSKSEPAHASAKATSTTQKAQQKWDGYAPYALYQTLENL